MGRITKNNITGAVGPLVFYESQGQYLVRTRANKVRQSQATKKSAQAFGLATKWSKQFRRPLTLITKSHKDRSLMYRLNTALQHWLNESKDDPVLRKKNIRELAGFQLNEQATHNRLLNLDIASDFSQPGKVVVHMPAFVPLTDIKAPSGTNKIELILVAVANSAGEENDSSSSPAEYSMKTIELNYRTDEYPGELIELPLEINTGDIVLAAIGINFWKGERKNELRDTNVKWVNGKVVGVEYVMG